MTEVVSPSLPLALLDVREDDLLYLSIKNDLPGSPAPNVRRQTHTVHTCSTHMRACACVCVCVCCSGRLPLHAVDHIHRCLSQRHVFTPTVPCFTFLSLALSLYSSRSITTPSLPLTYTHTQTHPPTGRRWRGRLRRHDSADASDADHQAAFAQGGQSRCASYGRRRRLYAPALHLL